MVVTTETLLEHIMPMASTHARSYIRHNLTTITRVNGIINQRPTDTPLTNYITVGILYRVTHFNHNSMTESTSLTLKFKKQKKEYDRIYMFGDLDGSTFCIIHYSERTSRQACSLCLEQCVIGQPFVLVLLTSPQNKDLKTDMPVLSSDVQILPLQQTFVRELPLINITYPTESQETCFFLQRKCQVNPVNVKLAGKGDIFKPNCGGVFCDRMHITERDTEKCGCFCVAASASRSSVVLQCNVYAEAPKEKFVVMKHRSYRTTVLFFHDIGLFEQSSETKRLQMRFDLEQTVQQACAYINEHGGFTIMGTLSRGQIHDESNQAADIAAVRVVWAICYLQPTNLNILKTEEYMNLQFQMPDSEHEEEDEDEDQDQQKEKGQKTKATSKKKATSVEPNQKNGS